MARGPLAGASGPGKFSARTDGLELGSIAYGEGVDTQAIKSGAPLAKTPDVRGATNTEVRQAAESVTPLFAPTQRPNEPIQAGIDRGPGPGSSALGMQQQADTQYVNAYQLFNQLASNPDASPAMKYLAQRIQQGF